MLKYLVYLKYLAKYFGRSVPVTRATHIFVGISVLLLYFQSPATGKKIVT